MGERLIDMPIERACSERHLQLRVEDENGLPTSAQPNVAIYEKLIEALFWCEEARRQGIAIPGLSQRLISLAAAVQFSELGRVPE
jgi:hypothetical protein